MRRKANRNWHATLAGRRKSIRATQHAPYSRELAIRKSQGSLSDKINVFIGHRIYVFAPRPRRVIWGWLSRCGESKLWVPNQSSWFLLTAAAKGVFCLAIFRGSPFLCAYPIQTNLCNRTWPFPPTTKTKKLDKTTRLCLERTNFSRRRPFLRVSPTHHHHHHHKFRPNNVRWSERPQDTKKKCYDPHSERLPLMVQASGSMRTTYLCVQTSNILRTLDKAKPIEIAVICVDMAMLLANYSQLGD